MRDLRIGALRWAVGLYCAVLGAQMVVTPHQFGFAAAAALRPNLPWWGAGLLLSGVALLATTATSHRPLQVVAHASAAAVLVLLAGAFAAAGAGAAALNHLVLGVGTAFAPFLAGAGDRRPASGGRDLFVGLMGISAVAFGLITLLAPRQAHPVNPELSAAAWVWYGIAFLGSGLALAITQLRPAHRSSSLAAAVNGGPEPRWSWPAVYGGIYDTHYLTGVLAHLLAGGTFMTFLLFVLLPARAWTGVAYFGGFGLVLVLFPWLGPRLRRVDPACLQTRLALALALAAAVPLIVVMARHAADEAGLATAQALAYQEHLAATLAQDVGDYVGLHRAAVASIAMQPGLLDLSPEAQGRLLRAASRAYADLVGLATYDAAGVAIARSNDLPLTSVAALPVFEEVRRSNRPAVDLRAGRARNPPLILFGAPIRDADGRFSGLVAGSLEVDHLARLLIQVSIGVGVEAYLVDGQGRVVAHPESSRSGSLAEPADRPVVAALLAALDERGSLSYQTPIEDRIAAYARVAGPGWGVVVERPTAVALAAARDQNDIGFLVLLLAIALAAVGGTVVAGRLAAPLGGLARAAKALAAGHRAPALPESEITEVAHLAAVFGEMRDRLAARTAELQRAEARFRGLLEAAPYAIVTIDRDGRLVLVNSEVERLFGYQREELLGQPIEVLLPERLREAHVRYRTAFFADPGKQTIDTCHECSARRKDGSEFPAETSFSLLQTDEGILVTAVLRDLTERKQAEEERARLFRREQAARRQAEETVLVNERLALASLEARRRLEMLYQATRQIGESLSLDVVLTMVLEATRQVFAADRAAICHHEETGRCVCPASFGLSAADAEAFCCHFVGSEPKPKATRPGPRLIAHLPSVTRGTPLAAVAALSGVRSVVTLPLLRRGQVVGNLAIFHDRPRQYLAEELKTAQALASQAAIAVDNARLYEAARRQAQEIEALYEATKQITRSLDLSATLNSILDAMVRLSEADLVGIALLDDATGTLRYEAARGLAADQLQRLAFRLGEALTGLVASSGEVVNVVDAVREPRWRYRAFAAATGIRSGLFSPLRAGGRVIGVLGAFSQQPGHFTPERERLLLGLAEQAALAIVRARDIAERQQAEEERSRLLASEQAARAEAEAALVANTRLVIATLASRQRLELLYEATRQVGVSLSLEPVLAAVLDATRQLFAADRAAIYYQDESGGHACLASFGLSPAYVEVMGRQVVSTLAYQQATSTGRPVFIPDAIAAAEGTSVHEALRAERIRAVLAAPLLLRSRFVGLLSIHHHEPRSYTDEELQTVQALANQAAIAVDNARLYEAARMRAKEIEALYEATKQITRSLDLSATLNSILDAILALSESDFAGVALLDASATLLRYNAVRGAQRPVIQEVSFGLGEGLIGLAAQKGVVVNVPDVEREPLWTHRVFAHDPARSRSIVFVPLRSDLRVIGVLVASSPERAHFTSERERLLLGLAEQAALAIVHANEVADRKRAEEALRASEQRFRDMATTVPDWIWEVDAEGCYTYSNPGAETVLGYAPEEVVGRPFLDLIHPEDRPAVSQLIGRASEARCGLRNLVNRSLTRDGRVVWLEYSASAVLDDQGRLVGYRGVGRDITQRIQIEQEREHLLTREQAARARAEALAAERAAILRQIADGVVISDADGRVVFINKAARRLLGVPKTWTSAEILARFGSALTLDGQPIPPPDQPLARAAQHGEIVADLQFRIRRSDGTEVVVQGSATPITGEGGARIGAVLTLHDITARQALERQKDEFLANVSHDLRTPLTAIKASIGVVLANEPPGTPEPLHRLLVNIDLAANRMVMLVDDLLELTRVQAGRVQLRRVLFDVRDLAQRAARAIEPLAQTRGQRVEVDLPPAPLPLEADPDRLERALLNLLTNAHKYGRTGGVIRLTVERRPGEVILAVADDGPGIPEAEQARIFERFYRSEVEATRSSYGSGLGLPIARATVELHGGRLWVESTPGAGATFRLALPIALHASMAEKGGLA